MGRKKKITYFFARDFFSYLATLLPSIYEMNLVNTNFTYYMSYRRLFKTKFRSRYKNVLSKL